MEFGLPERKRTHTVMSTGVTRRRQNVGRGNPARAEFNKIYKKLKIIAPLHMSPLRVATDLPQNIPAAGQIFDMLSQIAEGDAYNQRHGTVTRTKRIIGRIVITPGTAQLLNSCVRIAVFRAPVGATVAQTLLDTVASSNPVANNFMSQVFMDRWLVIPPLAIDNSPHYVNFSIPFKGKGYRSNYSGSGSGTQTGESLFIAYLSNSVAGATSPNLIGGNVEVWFQP